MRYRHIQHTRHPLRLTRRNASTMHAYSVARELEAQAKFERELIALLREVALENYMRRVNVMAPVVNV